MGRKEQQEELDALQSILYGDECQIVKNDGTDIRIILWTHVQLPEDFTIKFNTSQDSSEYTQKKISYLPPVKLDLKLPEGYPAECPPKFKISCPWLTKLSLSKVCGKLDKIWCDNGNMEVIYIWFDFLRNDLLNFLEIVNELDLSELHLVHLKYMDMMSKRLECSCEKDSDGNGNDGTDESSKLKVSPLGVCNADRGETCNSECDTSQGTYVEKVLDKRAQLDLNFETSPLQGILSYNSEREKLEFNKKYFMCNICYAYSLGIDCTKFENCDHIFCNTCISHYFTVQINEGAVYQIKCPENKCTSDATLTQVKNRVSPDVFSKYDSLLLQSALDSLKCLVYCPRRFCQYPATKDPEKNFATCPNCQYVFCIVCKMVYHGIEPCRFSSDELKKLTEKYLTGSREEQNEMELKYGLKFLRSIVDNTLAQSWIGSNCKNCPRCDVSIEKSQGCNRMICWKCGTYFCWLCLAELDPVNPYFHFSHSRCANKLFFDVIIDEDEYEMFDTDDEE